MDKLAPPTVALERHSCSGFGSGPARTFVHDCEYGGGGGALRGIANHTLPWVTTVMSAPRAIHHRDNIGQREPSSVHVRGSADLVEAAGYSCREHPHSAPLYLIVMSPGVQLLGHYGCTVIVRSRFSGGSHDEGYPSRYSVDPVYWQSRFGYSFAR